MPSSFNRCTGLAGREPSRATIAYMCTTIDVEHLPRYLASLGEIKHRLGDVTDIDEAS